MGKQRVITILFLGLVAISFGSIFVKLCDAPSFVIASYRLGIASLFYLGTTWMSRDRVWKGLPWSQRRVAVISGLFLTLHFTTWISSLKYTSVASSVVLVQTAPIFVGIGSYVFLRERPGRFTIMGIVITLSGAVIIGANDFAIDSASVLGNGLAVLGAIGAAGYMLAGRKLRSSMNTRVYVTIVYSICASLIIFMTLSSGKSFTGYDSSTYIYLVAAALLPQIIGHTIFNWALKFFTATTVSVVLLGEPIGATLLAYLILQETVSLQQIVGGIIILAGVSLVLYNENITMRLKKD
ncbi:DMT family transporter [candidate division KSB1 bacterium]|nr:DMT family transporter [candidate division KSB1 bacterium]